jgi:hypothetical protein
MYGNLKCGTVRDGFEVLRAVTPCAKRARTVRTLSPAPETRLLDSNHISPLPHRIRYNSLVLQPSAALYANVDVSCCEYHELVCTCYDSY